MQGRVHVADVALKQEKKVFLLLQSDCTGDDDGGVDIGAHTTGNNCENVVGVARFEIPAQNTSGENDL
jgi:hypothetical protein